MRYLWVGLLLAVFFAKQVIAEGEISADLVFERLCVDFGYQKGSGEFERCMENSRKNGAVKKNESGSATPQRDAQQPSGNAVDSTAADAKSAANGGAVNAASATQSQNEGRSDAEKFCDNYDYTKGSSGYAQCIEFAVAEGYATAPSKNQNAKRKKKPRM